MAVALGKVKPAAVPKLFEECEELFDERAELRDTALREAEGPGSSNELCVDFRLATLARLCIDDKALAKVDSIHLWKA